MAPAPKPQAAVPKTVAVGGMEKTVLVNTATLIRGRTYVYQNIHFKANIPQVVDKAMADFLAGQFHEVTDGEGEVLEKPYFDVEYGVPAPVEDKPIKRVTRLPARRPGV